MDENNVVQQKAISAEDMSNDELKKAVEAQLQMVRRQNLLVGAQSICRVILEKIYAHQAKPGKKSYRDYERLIKEIREFCEVGMSRKLNENGTISAAEKTSEQE